MTPLMTLKKLMRPAKGSVMVLKTNTAAGSLSAILRKVVRSVGLIGVARRGATAMSEGILTAIGARSTGEGA